ncbi:MAG: hypothetical protein JWN44_6619, partial [Myxococcales bacterium]|nr:hypothetical protein [Myxococcales bacterium]
MLVRLPDNLGARVEVLGLSGHINDVPLVPLIARVRRRLRWQAAFEGGARAGVLAAAAMLVGIYLLRLHLIARRGLVGFALAAVALVVAGAVAWAMRRIPNDRAAAVADSSHGLHDRLRSALAFLGEREPSAFMQAAIADAERAAGAV